MKKNLCNHERVYFEKNEQLKENFNEFIIPNGKCHLLKISISLIL